MSSKVKSGDEKQRSKEKELFEKLKYILLFI